MDGTRGYHPKRGKSERERQIPYDITYMWNLKYGTNEPIYKTEADSQDFPGGTVDWNPPANARDMGLIPGPGGFHMPWSNQGLHAATTKARVLRAYVAQ